MAFTDSGIYNYATKTIVNNGQYNLDRADIFEGDKFIWKDSNNYIIVTYEASTNSTYNYKVQFNIIINDSSIKIV